MDRCGFDWLVGLAEVPAQQVASDIGPDWRTRPVLTIVTNDQNTVSCQTNTVVELSGGMNRWNSATGRWIPAMPTLTLTDEGLVIAQGARHSARFAANINSASAIQIQFSTQTGPQWLKMHFLGLFYEDTVLGTNILIADLQDSAVQVVGHQVQYRDAFSGLNADIAYS